MLKSDGGIKMVECMKLVEGELLVEGRGESFVDGACVG